MDKKVQFNNNKNVAVNTCPSDEHSDFDWLDESQLIKEFKASTFITNLSITTKSIDEKQPDQVSFTPSLLMKPPEIDDIILVCID